MKNTAELVPVTVLRAVHDLRDKGNPPSTATEIAAHLNADTDIVLMLLIELKARKILTDVKRGRRREWQRWRT